jgi:hypothetical protein
MGVVTGSLPGACDWPDVKDRVEKMEIVASELSDPGEDRYELIAYHVDGDEIGRKEIPAY